jgi:hypothetical protein
MIHSSMARMPDKYCDTQPCWEILCELANNYSKNVRDRRRGLPFLDSACQASVRIKIHRHLIVVIGRGGNKMSIARWRADMMQTPHGWTGRCDIKPAIPPLSHLRTDRTACALAGTAPTCWMIDECRREDRIRRCRPKVHNFR